VVLHPIVVLYDALVLALDSGPYVSRQIRAKACLAVPKWFRPDRSMSL